MKSSLKVTLLFFLALLALMTFNDQELFLESQESKTVVGRAVYNRIKLLSFKDKDVWMMNQSHHGANAEAQNWDRLAIVVDKTRSPKTVKFYQLEPGPLQWGEGLKERPHRVSCFVCHNNGPRAIRPNFDSSMAPIRFADTLKIKYWNLRMKSYGRVLEAASLPESYENEPLRVATCLKCHKEEGFAARGLLRRKHWPTIKFMVDSGNMPPLGFSMSENEKTQLDVFLAGF